MVNYNCLRCGYETNIKTILVRHLSRKIPCKAIYEDIPTEQLKKKLLDNEYKKECENYAKTAENHAKTNEKYTKNGENHAKVSTNVNTMSTDLENMSTNVNIFQKNLQNMSTNVNTMSTDIQNILPNSDSEELKYTCEFCEKIFTTRQGKWRHLKS